MSLERAWKCSYIVAHIYVFHLMFLFSSEEWWKLHKLNLCIKKTHQTYLKAHIYSSAVRHVCAYKWKNLQRIFLFGAIQRTLPASHFFSMAFNTSITQTPWDEIILIQNIKAADQTESTVLIKSTADPRGRKRASWLSCLLPQKLVGLHVESAMYDHLVNAHHHENTRRSWVVEKHFLPFTW